MPNLGPQSTSFTLDTMGRFLCNTPQEATDSVNQTLHGHDHPFDVIIVGGGTFGGVLAARLFALDPTNSRRILVLEGGSFVLPEHAQNTDYGNPSPTPPMRVPWEAHPGLSYAGLLYAVGGRSLLWGGWSPELLSNTNDNEMLGWPASVINELQSTYFHEAAEQIGVNSTTDFISGLFHNVLRDRLYAALTGASPPAQAVPLADLPEDTVVRAFRKKEQRDPTDAELHDMLDLDPSDTRPRAEMLNLLKLDAPLAVEARTEPGKFPNNKFSSVPLITKASRQAAGEADGAGAEADARKRLMVVGSCHVQELITETQPDSWVRVVGVRVSGPGDATIEYRLRPPTPDGRQGIVVLAAGTIECTRIALTTFQQSLAGRAAQRMGRNLMCHLRSNFTMRIPINAYPALLGIVSQAMSVSALFVKGKANINGKDRYFHLQITASGAGPRGADSEAELFKKIPDLDTLDKLRQASDDTIVLVLRGIGEMSPQNPDSSIVLPAPAPDDFFRPRVNVSIGNAHDNSPAASQQTRDDHDFWDAMDDFTEQLALVFANGKPFTLLDRSGAFVADMPATATVADIKNKYDREKYRRDGLGTTHHEAGPLWMGDNVATSVTNEFGRIHDTTNCYVVGPALFPTIGSPNPMLTGVALARRTGKMLTDNVLRVVKTSPEAGFTSLFDGTRASYNNWEMIGQGKMDLRDGILVTRPSGLGLFVFRGPSAFFDDFELRLQFFLEAFNNFSDNNSGVFVRFVRPELPLSAAMQGRADPEPFYDRNNRAWNPVFTGFEIQIDETAAGNPGEPDPDKHRTGAIYNIPTQPGWIMQNFTGRPNQSKLNDWNDYVIRVIGDTYTVFLNGEQTTTYTNTDTFRGKPKSADAKSGLIGLQTHTGRMGFRNIRIMAL